MGELSARDRAILAALHCGFCMSGQIATVARIGTMSPKETAARHLIRLTKAGLAEQVGTRMFPQWRITSDGIKAMSTGNSPAQEPRHGRD